MDRQGDQNNSRRRCTDGVREVLRMNIGRSEAEPLWANFLRSLTRAGG